jgi:hypothetical protein
MPNSYVYPGCALLSTVPTRYGETLNARKSYVRPRLKPGNGVDGVNEPVRFS